MGKGFSKRPIKVLWHGEYGFDTGFAGVSENILDRLHNVKTEWGTKKYEICVMQLGRGTNPFEKVPNKPYSVVPMYGNRGAAPFGQDYAQDLVRRFKPDIVVTFGDTWMVDFWNDHGCIPPDLRKTFKLVGYVAIDGYPVPHFWIDKYRHFDKIITFTKFGKDAIEERAKEMGIKLNVAQIYHGVDIQTFKPLPQAEIDNYKKQRGLEGKKIIGMFSRNQPRKHHPEFIEFADRLLQKTNGDPNIMFYFHTIERDAGWDLPALIHDIDKLNSRARFLKNGTFSPGQEIPKKDYTLENRFFFPGIKNPAEGYTKEHLNMMYNICDAHLLCTSGEGFGCTVVESLSAGVPTFTNDYAASSEMIKDSKGGEVVAAREFTYRGQDHNFYRPHMNYDDAIDKILPVLNDPELKKKYSKKARAYAWGMSWDIMNDEWDKELSDLYEFNPEIEQRAEIV